MPGLSVRRSRSRSARARHRDSSTAGDGAVSWTTSEVTGSDQPLCRNSAKPSRVPASSKCAATRSDRDGPYATREDAARAPEIARERAANWNAED